MGNCHWHWVKAKSCDVVQAHKSCTSHAHWRNAITFTRMRSFLLAWTRTLGFVGLTISRNATELFRHVLFYATFYDSPLLGRSLFIIFFFSFSSLLYDDGAFWSGNHLSSRPWLLIFRRYTWFSFLWRTSFITDKDVFERSNDRS